MADRNDTPFLQLDLPFGPREEWKPVPGYEGLYEVSNRGQVRSVKRGAPLHQACWRDYLTVHLSKLGKTAMLSVHGLVLSAFVEPRPDGLQANHIDGNKRNNALSNLEWVTQSENMRHAVRMGLHDIGERHYGAKLTEKQVREIRTIYAQGGKIRVLAREFGVTRRNIRAIVDGLTWKHLLQENTC